MSVESGVGRGGRGGGGDRGRRDIESNYHENWDTVHNWKDIEGITVRQCLKGTRQLRMNTVESEGRSRKICKMHYRKANKHSNLFRKFFRCKLTVKEHFIRLKNEEGMRRRKINEENPSLNLKVLYKGNPLPSPPTLPNWAWSDHGEVRHNQTRCN